MLILLAASFGDAERASWLSLLRDLLPRDEIITAVASDEQRAQVRAAIVANPPHGALQNLPNLRLIQSLWAGVDRLLTDATLPADVPVCRMVDPAMNVAMAETALWAVLSLHRHYFEYSTQQRSSIWRVLPQMRADEVRVGVLGAGQMGMCAAVRLRRNGYRVSVWASRQRSAEEILAHGADLEGLSLHHGTDALPAVLASVDILINLLPLTPQTRGMLNKTLLGHLPRGASLGNFARGAHVVDEDLLEALNTGAIGRAVLDVYHQEPLPATHPFWTHERVTMLPHAAALTDPRSAAKIAVRNIDALREGAALANTVDRVRGY